MISRALVASSRAARTTERMESTSVFGIASCVGDDGNGARVGAVLRSGDVGRASLSAQRAGAMDLEELAARGAAAKRVGDLRDVAAVLGDDVDGLP